MAAKQVKTVAPKGGGGSPVVTQKVQHPVETQSQETSLKDLKEFIRESMLTQTAAMNNQTTIIDGKLKEFAEEIKAIKDVVEQKHDEIREDIILAVSGLSKTIIELEDRVEEINEANLNLENKVGEMGAKAERVDEDLIMLQYRSMEFALRLRGLKENNRENLRDICAEALSVIIEERPENIAIQIDKIYRVNSWVARQKQLPRDVVIYFTSRRFRNEVLQASYKNKLQADGKDILVLKEIPSKMLRDRKDFGFLVNELRNRQIQYRWDVPIGLTVTYGGEKYRLNSPWKAKDFYANVLKAGCPPPSGEGRKEKKKEILQQETEGKQVQTYAEVAAGGAVLEDDSTQFEPLQLTSELSKGMEEAKEQRLT